MTCAGCRTVAFYNTPSSGPPPPLHSTGAAHLPPHPTTHPLLQLLERGGDSPELVQGACALLCTLTNPDDDTQPSSRAFPNARALGKEGAAAVLVGALRQGREAGQPPEATAALCTALKQVRHAGGFVGPPALFGIACKGLAAPSSRWLHRVGPPSWYTAAGTARKAPQRCRHLAPHLWPTRRKLSCLPNHPRPPPLPRPLPGVRQ